MISREEVEARVQAALPDAKIVLEDLTGGGDHYRMLVVSSQFAGLPRVRRHRLVYAPLQDVLGGALHALALTTQTPEERDAA